MGVYLIKMPDVGEGVAEAELVEWLVAEGENVIEDQLLASVMTDKATVEIPAPVEGKIIWRGGNIGEVIAVGSPLIRIEVDGAGNVKDDAVASADTEKTEAASADHVKKPEPVAKDVAPPAPSPATTNKSAPLQRNNAPAAAEPKVTRRKEGETPLASPAVRKRALDNGIDLRRVQGSGPEGRITHDDLDRFFSGDGAVQSSTRSRAPNASVIEIPVVGLRRKIAEKMSLSKSRIPHITYVEEIDVTALEALRSHLNSESSEGWARLTMLPFLMRAMAKAIEAQPQLNSLYDDEAGIVHQYGGMHMGVATQTPGGLVVPVVRHVEALNVRECGDELTRLAKAARDGKCTREELTGSTITITSLGAMGGIVTTPVINHPEVAIVGVNKMQVLPRWDGNQFVPKKVMNISSSFDHRVIDGWDAAVFVQKIKSLLEHPATIFIDD